MTVPIDTTAVQRDPQTSATSGTERKNPLRGQDSPAELRRACREFEAIFLRNFLKEAHIDRALSRETEGNANPYGDMVIESLARSVAEGGGMGLAEMLYRQLSPQIPQNAPDTLTSETPETPRLKELEALEKP